MGFSIPLADWLRGPLRLLLAETIHDAAMMEPLDASVAQRTLDEFLHLGVDHSSRLWTLLMYGMWRQHAYGAAR
ncbi:MAG: hypothetical protein IPJ33_00790 [Gammaproteobacteria bacterium]|nr:hypothetical protein [Gammaproteobacteria bacterium]